MILSLPTFTLLCFAMASHGESFADIHVKRSSAPVRSTAHSPVKRSLFTDKSATHSFHDNSKGSGSRLAAVSAAYTSVTGSAVGAVLKLISTCGLGAYASKVGILDKNSLTVLSKLVFSIFQPCLLFCNVAACIAKNKKDSALLVLPIAAMLQIFIGYFLAMIVSRVMYGNKDSDDKKQLIACTTFSNSGPLPLVFADSIFKMNPDTTLLPRSTAYISMYLLAWSPLFWALGSTILSADESKLSAAEKRDQLIKRILSPPIMGCLMGLVVGSIAPLSNVITKPDGLLFPVFGAMQTLGAAYLPAVLLVLAGSLLPQPSGDVKEETEPVLSAKEKNDGTILFLKRVVTVYISRFVLMPILGFSVLKFIQTNIPSVAGMLNDKLLLFILLLQACMPSAQNSTVILQLAGNRKAAASMARTLVAVYILGVPAMSYWLSRILSTTQILG
mmetsp:Transcript_40988/g.41862  ORF Transcript_40988/g.41862 Transcript_40988/m.41862 type:complete len:445 (+) Transcript_40988:80-1414(+)